MKKKKIQKGFTLIEILVVIGIIAILAAVVLIAINPARQFAQARNSQRVSNVNTILNAIGQRLADNKGIFGGGTINCPMLPASTASSSIITNTFIGTWPTGTAGAGGTTINLSCLTPTYMAAFPVDPDSTFAVSTFTGYEVSTNANSRVLICAPKAATENAIPTAEAICVTR